MLCNIGKVQTDIYKVKSDQCTWCGKVHILARSIQINNFSYKNFKCVSSNYYTFANNTMFSLIKTRTFLSKREVTFKKNVSMDDLLYTQLYQKKNI